MMDKPISSEDIEVDGQMRSTEAHELIGEHKRNVFYIGEWLVDLERSQVSNKTTIRALEPKANAVLRLLIAAEGSAVSRKQLQQQVWNGTVVSDAAVNRVIAQLRKAFSDTATSSTYIVTLPKVGYRLEAKVSEPSTGEIANFRGKLLFTSIFLLIVSVFGYLYFSYSLSTEPDSDELNLQLTNLIGEEVDPQLSASGRYLTFSHSTQSFSKASIYVKDLESNRVLRVTNGQYIDSSPSWSPDGKQLVFMRSSKQGCEIRQNSINWSEFTAGEEKIIFKCSDEQALKNFSWEHLTPANIRSEDNVLILSLKPAAASPTNTYRYDIETNSLTMLLKATELGRGNLNSVVSPDGTSLAVFHDSFQKYEIMVYKLPNLEIIQTISVAPAAIRFKWSPDSRSILYSHPVGVTRFDIAESKTTMIYESKLPLRSIDVLDESNFLVSMESHGTDIGYFSLAKDSFSNVGSIAKHRNFLMYPRYSPNGKKIAYANFDDVAPHLVVKDLKTNEAKSIEFSQYLFVLGWNPDQKGVYGTGLNSAWSMDTEIGEFTQLTPNGWKIISPSWSANGDYLFFASQQSGDWQIWRLEIKSQQLTQMTNEGGLTVKASNDNRYIYYNKQKEIGLWQLDLKTNVTKRLFDYDRESFWPDYFPVKNGGYYVVYDNSVKKLKYYSFANASTRTLYDIPGQWGSQFSINADESKIAFENFSAIESNIQRIDLKIN
jgi:Tol biopolymer transport system component/DNA-binding winged helix-turn-helix (wHTH) protein